MLKMKNGDIILRAWCAIALGIFLCSFQPIPIRHNLISSKDSNVSSSRDSLSHLIDSILKSKDRHQLPRLYAELGQKAQDEGLYHLSVTYFSNSNEFSDYYGDQSQKAQNYNSIATSYRRLDEFGLAVDYLSRAINLANKIDNKQVQSYALNGLGNVYLAQGHPDKAISLFTESLKLAIQSNNKLGIAINNANLGLSYDQKKQYGTAISYLYKSLEVNQAIKSYRGIKICYGELSRIYLKRNKIGKAVEYANLRLNGTSATEPIDSVDFFLTMAKIRLHLNDLDSGLYYAHNAARIAKRIETKNGSKEAYALLATLYKRHGMFHQYLKYYEQELIYKDSLLKEQNSKTIADFHSISIIEQQEMQIKKLVQANRIMDIKNSKSESLLIAVISLATALLLLIFIVSRKITQKALKTTSDYEIRYRRSQINPHFIYNSLNSIQKFIWSNNPEIASIYLSNFSTLMRKTLESMRQDEMLLAKEIELLKLYLELEKQRLSNVFNFYIEIDPSVKPDEIMVPPLILQPFVENAIWHGIAPLPKEQEGSVTLRYNRNKNFLIAQVEDSGIGVKASLTQKTQHNTHHSSEGIKIVGEHLKLSYKQNNIGQFHDITITDLSDLDNGKHGTIVTVVIPFKEIY